MDPKKQTPLSLQRQVRSGLFFLLFFKLVTENNLLVNFGGTIFEIRFQQIKNHTQYIIFKLEIFIDLLPCKS